jgi:hypothetical protein
VIVDLQLINIHPTSRVVTFKMTAKPITGIMKLVQMVILSLFNVPGRDLLDPEMGGGIPEMIGMNFDQDDLTEILSELTRRIKVTEAEIFKSQIISGVTSEEKLKELKIVSVGPGTTEGEVAARIRIVNALGKQVEAVV